MFTIKWNRSQLFWVLSLLCILCTVLISFKTETQITLFYYQVKRECIFCGLQECHITQHTLLQKQERERERKGQQIMENDACNNAWNQAYWYTFIYNAQFHMIINGTWRPIYGHIGMDFLIFRTLFNLCCSIKIDYFRFGLQFPPLIWWFESNNQECCSVSL